MKSNRDDPLLSSHLILQYMIFSGGFDGELCGNLKETIKRCTVPAVSICEISEIITKEIERQDNDIVKAVLAKLLKEFEKKA